MAGSLGPRWAIYGPCMAAVMGGGGGKDGLLHILKHLMPGVKVWMEDMRANLVGLNGENIHTLNDSIQEMMAKRDMGKEQRERGKLLVDLLKANDNFSKSK